MHGSGSNYNGINWNTATMQEKRDKPAKLGCLVTTSNKDSAIEFDWQLCCQTRSQNMFPVLCSFHRDNNSENTFVLGRWTDMTQRHRKQIHWVWMYHFYIVTSSPPHPPFRPYRKILCVYLYIIGGNEAVIVNSCCVTLNMLLRETGGKMTPTLYSECFCQLFLQGLMLPLHSLLWEKMVC